MRRGVAHGNANGTRIGRRLGGIETIETGVVPGLSYTTFKYSAFVSPSSVEACDSFAVTVDVTNTGAVAGDEVVQLYATTPGASVPAPRIRLADFERVHIQPGETVKVGSPS